MGSRPGPAPRVYIHTLGCPKNEADSRGVMRSLRAAGTTLVQDPDQATHILLNTCGFIEEAKEESIAAILDACAGYPDKAVLVMGCLVERYRDDLARGIPEVSGWFGLAGGQDMRELARSLQPEAAAAVAADGQERDRDERVKAALGSQGASYAYVKISDGCDEPCTFCAIPAIKGPYRSATTADIVREADACLAEGARELVLVGQDTAVWNSDGLDLIGLVDLLAADERVARLRVMYLQPEHVTDVLLRYMAGQPKLCRYLDVPFQHSHPEILRKMGRGGDGDAYLALLERAGRLMPDVAVRTAFIVGFPGERAEHFDHLLGFVEAAEFDYAGGFVYSPEEGTAAANLRPVVRRAVARDRLNRLNAVLGTCAERKHQRMVGSRFQVLIDAWGAEGPDEGVSAVGRTAGQAPEVDGVTYIEGLLPEGAGPGDVVEVTVTAAVGYDLVGVCEAT